MRTIESGARLMKIAISKNLTERTPADLALVILLTLSCTPSVLGLALNHTPFGIRLVPVLVVLSVFTISLAVVAGVRRQGLPEGERFVVVVGELA